MSYSFSQLDKDNKKWFEKDNTRGTLASIQLESGRIRGLTPLELSFEYPISVISGTNGSGKSTILALAACAFHNRKTGFLPPLRNRNYYTFQDFFVQSSSETPVDGVSIAYGIRYDHWHKRGAGLGRQVRKKKKGGKWNGYDSRVNRNVIYFGVQRVVPHFERSVHKSHRSKFKPGSISEDNRIKIAAIASRVIGKSYTDFDSFEYTKYSLPVATNGGISYSGFNMGAGESAIFEILTALFQAGPGALLVIDEVELGLHELAQTRFIEQLKLLCLEMKCQVICSTHSYSVLKALPPEARFHIENIEGKSFVTKGISADYACGKMGRPDAFELDIFVEDRVAREILLAVLPFDLRKRVNIKVIGSHSAVVRQLSSRYIEGVNNCISILDGDQAASQSDALKSLEKSCEPSTDEEKEKVQNWGSDRMYYLPGKEWPERWLVRQAIEKVANPSFAPADELASLWGLSNKGELMAALSDANSAEKHKEFFELANSVELDMTRVRSDVIALVVKDGADFFADIVKGVRGKLP